MAYEKERQKRSAVAVLSADHHPVSLVFADAELERDYRHAVHWQTLGVMRFSVVLAIVLYIWFGGIDIWILGEEARASWTIRGIVAVLSGGVFALSLRKRFFRIRESAMALLVLLLTAGLIAIVSIQPAIMDMYYVGFILMIVGIFTIFGLRFPNALAVSLAIVALYLLAEYFLRDAGYAVVVNNATFLIGAFVIAAIGSYTAERQRRLAYFRLRIIEQERAASEHVALHDPLTGLPNRRLLLEKLEQAIARAVRCKTRCAVLFIDLDGFKAVNDERGHAFGDRLLKFAATRLSESLRAAEMVARYGGDEFVVLLEDVHDTAGLDALIARVRRSFAEPCEVDGVRLVVSCSIGCAMHPRNGATARELLEAADASMYRVKRTRGLEQDVS